jgi:membrane-bound lytic murein transglycosylase B
MVVAGLGATEYFARQPGDIHHDHLAVVVGSAPIAAAPLSPVADVPVEPSRIEGIAAKTGVSASWLARTAAAIGIQPVALDAFARAALVIGKTDPGCHLGWNALAAIGYQESADGTLGGSSVASNGDVTPTILGPILDGGRYDAVRDSDGGALDGNSTWDRAVGPMQFLPSTWHVRGLDGNGDGVADPNNLDDAALTTGVYLCASGRSLVGAAAWDDAVSSFNHSASYVASVSAVANRYAAETR